MNQRVLLLHTGGTFGMELEREASAQHDGSKGGPKSGTQGGAQTAKTGQAPNLLARLPELGALAAIESRVLFNLDSSDVGPAHWTLIAETILAEWEKFDGFVVIHGTDTLAYTGAALAFFFSELTKPIVLTGSQRPLSELRSDARSNLIDSVEFATLGMPEVVVVFDSRVHFAVRATKHSNEHLQAFASFNAPLLGEFGVHFRRASSFSARSPVPDFKRHRPVYDPRLDPRISTLTCTPGAGPSEALAETLVRENKGLILRGFGCGNLPILQDDWLALCRKAQSAEVPVVMASQSAKGAIALDAYENGRRYAEAGVIPALDMSFEATALKLMVMLGRGIPYARRHEFFRLALASECSANPVGMAP